MDFNLAILEKNLSATNLNSVKFSAFTVAEETSTIRIKILVNSFVLPLKMENLHQEFLIYTSIRKNL